MAIKFRDRILLLLLVLFLLLAPIIDVLDDGCISEILGTGGKICGSEANRKTLIMSIFVIFFYVVAWIKFDFGLWSKKKKK